MCLVLDYAIKTATAKVATWEEEISIYQCPAVDETGSFYIYNLAPSNAESAYCAGDIEPCGQGLMYNGIQCVGKC